MIRRCRPVLRLGGASAVFCMLWAVVGGQEVRRRNNQESFEDVQRDRVRFGSFDLGLSFFGSRVADSSNVHAFQCTMERSESARIVIEDCLRANVEEICSLDPLYIGLGNTDCENNNDILIKGGIMDFTWSESVPLHHEVHACVANVVNSEECYYQLKQSSTDYTLLVDLDFVHVTKAPTPGPTLVAAGSADSATTPPPSQVLQVSDGDKSSNAVSNDVEEDEAQEEEEPTPSPTSMQAQTPTTDVEMSSGSSEADKAAALDSGQSNAPPPPYTKAIIIAATAGGAAMILCFLAALFVLGRERRERNAKQQPLDEAQTLDKDHPDITFDISQDETDAEDRKPSQAEAVGAAQPQRQPPQDAVSQVTSGSTASRLRSLARTILPPSALRSPFKYNKPHEQQSSAPAEQVHIPNKRQVTVRTVSSLEDANNEEIIPIPGINLEDYEDNYSLATSDDGGSLIFIQQVAFEPSITAVPEEETAEDKNAAEPPENDEEAPPPSQPATTASPKVAATAEETITLEPIELVESKRNFLQRALNPFFGSSSGTSSSDTGSRSSQNAGAGGDEHETTSDFGQDPTWNPDDNSVTSSCNQAEEAFQEASLMAIEVYEDERSMMSSSGSSSRQPSIQLDASYVPPELLTGENGSSEVILKRKKRRENPPKSQKQFFLR